MKKFLGVLMVLAMVSTGAFAQTDVFVRNHSFEAQMPDSEDTYGVGTYGYGYFIEGAPTGWDTNVTYMNSYNYMGVLGLSYWTSYGPADHGVNALSWAYQDWADPDTGSYPSYGGEVYQTTDEVIKALRDYTLTVAISAFDSDPAIGDLAKIRLYAVAVGDDEDTRADRVDLGSATAQIQYQTPTDLSITINSSELNGVGIGGKLGVALEGAMHPSVYASGMSMALFDNVRVSWVVGKPTTPYLKYITGSAPYAVEGQAYTLTAPGKAPFQWSKDGVDIPETDATIEFGTLVDGPADEGIYNVKFNDGVYGGTKRNRNSLPFELTVIPLASEIPVTGLLGLGLLAGACALSGAVVLRRKK